MYSKIGPKPYTPRKKPRGILTRRQAEIAVLMCQGLKAREIASELNLSYKTIETHRQQMMERTGCHSAQQVIMYAIEHGYYRPPGVGCKWPTIHELQEYLRLKAETYFEMREHSLKGPLSARDLTLVKQVIEGICTAMTVEPTRGLAPKEEVEVDG